MSTKQWFLRAMAHYGTADIFFMRSSTSFGHRRSSAPTTYIYIYIYILYFINNIYIFIYFLCGDIYILGTSRNGNFWRSPSVARKRTISTVFFCVVCFFFTVVCAQGLKCYTPHATLITIGHPTNYILDPPPCRKSWAMII